MAQFFDAVERAHLSDLFDELGPQAPTLLEPWTTRDLAAHLVLRERDYLAGPGLALSGGWGRLAERRRKALALRDFAWLIATLRSGPPPGFFRIGWVRRFPSLNEFFVHHEDVRRANGRGPRVNEHAMDEALWRNVTRAPWFLARRLRGAGLELHWAGTAQTVRARRGEPAARIAGPPGELLLYLFGRQGAAHVEVSGPDAAIEAVRRARFGMLQQARLSSRTDKPAQPGMASCSRPLAVIEAFPGAPTGWAAGTSDSWSGTSGSPVSLGSAHQRTSAGC